MVAVNLKFVCPNCKAVVFEGTFNSDLEADVQCSQCGYTNELWGFPHTVTYPIDFEKIDIWTCGGHYTNDAPSDFEAYYFIEEYFLWMAKVTPRQLVHGAAPYALGSLQYVSKIANKDDIDDDKMHIEKGTYAKIRQILPLTKVV